MKKIVSKQYSEDFQFDFGQFLNEIGMTGICTREYGMPDTSALLIIISLDTYTLPLSCAGYISYIVQSSCNNSETIIPSEGLSTFNNNLILHCLSPDGIYSNVQAIITPTPTYTI